MLRIPALLALTVPLLLGTPMLPGVSVVHAQKTDPSEFPPEIILDRDWAEKRERAQRQRIYDEFMSDPLHRAQQLAAEGRIDEGLAVLREGLDAPCDDQACQVKNGLYFLHFIKLNSSSWSDDQFLSLMQEAREVIERVEGAKKHDLMFLSHLVDEARAEDAGDVTAYQRALDAAHEEVARIRAEGKNYAGLATEDEITWLIHRSGLEELRNQPNAALHTLRRALKLTRQKPDMVRDDQARVLFQLSAFFEGSDPARSKKYYDEACDHYDQVADPFEYKKKCQAPSEGK